jgi:hypothetical protein
MPDPDERHPDTDQPVNPPSISDPATGDPVIPAEGDDDGDEQP